MVEDMLSHPGHPGKEKVELTGRRQRVQQNEDFRSPDGAAHQMPHDKVSLFGLSDVDSLMESWRWSLGLRTCLGGSSLLPLHSLFCSLSCAVKLRAQLLSHSLNS